MVPLLFQLILLNGSSVSLSPYISIFHACSGGHIFPIHYKTTPLRMPSLPFNLCLPNPRSTMFPRFLIWSDPHLVPLGSYLSRQAQGVEVRRAGKHQFEDFLNCQVGLFLLFLKISLSFPHLNFVVLALRSAKPQKNGPRKRKLMLKNSPSTNHKRS